MHSKKPSKCSEFTLATGLSVLDYESSNLCFLTSSASILPEMNSAPGFPVLDVRSLIAEVLLVQFCQDVSRNNCVASEVVADLCMEAV